MNAAAKQISVAGALGIVALGVSQADSLLAQAEKYFGSSGYALFGHVFKYEIFFLVLVAVAVGEAIRYRRWYSATRRKWKGKRYLILGQQWYAEEVVACGALIVLALSFSTHMVRKGTTVYHAYGLQYIAQEACEGRFSEAVDRIKALQKSHLWSKYGFELNEGLERYSYLREATNRRRDQFRGSWQQLTAEELLMEAVELKAIFGVEVSRSISTILGRSPDNERAREWRLFLARSVC